ncbi:MAG: SsrA-binding protein SmpB [Caulobacteraceae bacterium]
MSKLIAENRRARFRLLPGGQARGRHHAAGTEVKALREGRANIAESYVGVEGRDLALINAHIPEYGPANRFNHEPRRQRKLLLHRKQIDKLIGAAQREGRTLVPTRLYFNDKGLVKLEVALAKGKKEHDKRATEARDWKRDQGRLMRERGVGRFGRPRHARQAAREGRRRGSPLGYYW